MFSLSARVAFKRSTVTFCGEDVTFDAQERGNDPDFAIASNNGRLGGLLAAQRALRRSQKALAVSRFAQILVTRDARPRSLLGVPSRAAARSLECFLRFFFLRPRANIGIEFGTR